MSGDFTPEQKRYLEGFTAGLQIYRDVKAEDAPAIIERMLKAYLAHRAPDESFLTFTRRHDVTALKEMGEAAA